MVKQMLESLPPPQVRGKIVPQLMDFVDQSQDKELWVPFFHENGLFSIRNNDHFPWKKVNQYTERFAERFRIPKRSVIN